MAYKHGVYGYTLTEADIVALKNAGIYLVAGV